MRLHLYQAAEQRWRRCCPCCGVDMRSGKRLKRGHPMPRNVRTDGHDVAVAHGGDRHTWLAICYGCNNDQGWLSFAGWARMLILADDKRASRVVEVAHFIQAWREREKRRQAA